MIRPSRRRRCTRNFSAKVRDAAARVIFGQDEVIDQTLVTLLAGGHGLLIGVPGLAKTRLVETLGIVLGLDWKRIQFTPDLMPADIIGSEVMEESETGQRSFRFIRGPVFTQLLMADEINRASPRTQSALLQAMQEKHVTVAGARYDLPRPVPCAGDAESAGAGRHLSAARSPARPFPAADRCRLSRRGRRTPHADGHHHRRGSTARARLRCPTRSSARSAWCGIMPVGEKVMDAILRLVRAARPDEGGMRHSRPDRLGARPARQPGLHAGGARRRLMDGRLAPSIDDVVALARAGAAPSHGAEFLPPAPKAPPPPR